MRIIFMFLLFFLFNSTNFCVLKISANDMSAREIFDRSMNSIIDEVDEKVLKQKLSNLVMYSHLSSDISIITDLLDQRIHHLSNSNNLFQLFEITKAQLLARDGRWEDAQRIFEKAINEHWDNAIPSYLNCMTSVGKNKLRAIEEFNRCVDRPHYLDYRGRQEDLSVFITVMLFAKEDNSQMSAMKDIFPYLLFNDKDPNYLELSRALCMMADHKYTESFASLNGLDTKLSSEPLNDTLWKSIPLYMAWVLFEEGKDYNQARNFLRIYYERNINDPGHVLGRILRIAYYFERIVNHKPRIVEITKYLLDCEIFSDPAIKAKVNQEVKTNLLLQQRMPDDLYLHVLELHAHGLSWIGQWDESVAIWDYLIETCYPHTITGVAAAMSKATYLAFGAKGKKRKFSHAELILRDILENSDYSDMIPHVKRLLAKIMIQRGKYNEATALLQDVIDRIDPQQTYNGLYRCKKAAEKHLSLVNTLTQ